VSANRRVDRTNMGCLACIVIEDASMANHWETGAWRSSVWFVEEQTTSSVHPRCGRLRVIATYMSSGCVFPTERTCCRSDWHLCLEATDCELVLRWLERVLLRTFLISPSVPTYATPREAWNYKSPMRITTPDKPAARRLAAT
jgi:hypothetical protein